jgi:hypothetical protein
MFKVSLIIFDCFLLYDMKKLTIDKIKKITTIHSPLAEGPSDNGLFMTVPIKFENMSDDC